MRKMKFSLLLLLVVSVTSLLLGVKPAISNPETALSVKFANGTNSSVGEYQPGDTFSVTVDVSEVYDLYGYEFMIKYDPSMLTATGVTVGPFLLPIYTEWANEIDEAQGQVWYAASQSMPPIYEEPYGVDGDGTIATIDFTVDTIGPTLLLLSNAKLSDSNGVAMVFTAYSGFFENPPQRIGVALDTGWVENHRWIYSKDADKLVTFTAHIKDVDIGITFIRVRFTVLDGEGRPVWEALTDDVLVTYQGQQLRLSADLSPGKLANNFAYDIVFTLEYIDASGAWSIGQKGSPTGNRQTMIKSFTVEGL